MKFFTRTRTSIFFISLSAASLLTGYKVLRSVTDSIYLTTFGAAKIPYAMTFVPFVVVLGSLGFSIILKRFGPEKTFKLTTFLSGVFFLICYFAVLQKIPAFIVALYLIKEVYVVILVAQHWSFINSIVTTEESKKISGPVIGMTALGALIAGIPLQPLPKVIGSVQMIPIVCALTWLSILFIHFAYRITEERKEEISQPKSVIDHLGLKQLRTEKTILYLAILICLTQVISILFELSFLNVLQHEIPDQDVRSAYLVKMWNYADFLAFVLTFGVTPFLLTYLPMKAVQFTIPIFHFGTALLLWTRPSRTTASLAFFGFKVIDYNIFDAAKEVFYVPLSFASRYRAKQFVDSIVYRSAKGITSGVVSLFQSIFLALTPAVVFPPVCMGVALVWVWISKKLLSSSDIEHF